MCDAAAAATAQGLGAGVSETSATATDELTRQNSCRLCLAPASECISIINSYAADKEPLATKIQNCVNIKISSLDRFSLNICHACISYLNSWQSFKNRCLSSQAKQRQWQDIDKTKQQTLLGYLDLNRAENGNALEQHQHQQQQHQQQSEAALAAAEKASANILDGIPSLKKRKSLTVYPLPAVPIKDEPLDDTDDDYHMKSIDESDDMMDPTMFLERSEHEGDVPLMTSDYDYSAQHGVTAAVAAAAVAQLPATAVANVAAAGDSKVASCRACSLQFSTRANARRHERNLHPNLFQLSTDSPNNTPITKPTPALAAALEIQRAAAAAAATAEATKAAAGGNISAQKYRQVVMNTFIKCENGGYDYENPEQYQQLLTREKVDFIDENSEFLEQYQTMTCRCCNKYFSTYKNFMAHVRKKYPTLPRNLCFNCLKMNDSKALFISHLKKRNCINLYRMLNGLRAKQPNFTPSGDNNSSGSNLEATAAQLAAPATPNDSISSERPEKLRAKELLVNKLYECKLCPKGFRTKHEFRTHVYDKHADVQRKDNNSIQCSFCGLDFADPVDRRRHYNNMDCIVRLRCMTCDAKLETHQRFLEHVYQDHLGGVSSDSAATNEHSPGKRSLLGALGIGVSQSSSNDNESRSSGSQNNNNSTTTPLTSTPKPSGNAATSTPAAAATGASAASSSREAPKSQYFSRMPQVCPICGQQYNNYNNVLRHMESKHPNKLPETYKCVRCGLGYPRISYLREHMINVHGVDKNRHSGGFEYIVNADAVKLADGSTPNVYTGRYDYVMKDLMSITNGGTIDDEDEDTGNIAKKMRLDESSNNSSINTSIANQQKECPICNAVFSNNIGLSNHMRSHYTASTATNAALAAANRMTPKSLTITATPAVEATATSTSAAAAAAAASVTIIAAAATRAGADGAVPPAMANQTAQEQAVFRRSLDQAADRRFRRMRCRICQRRFSSKKSYRYHMLTDHQVQNVQFIKCKLCNAEFAYEKGLKVHLFKVHGRAIKDEMIVKQFECDVCSIVYSSELELQQHKRSVHKSQVVLDTGAKSSKSSSANATSNADLANSDAAAAAAASASLPLYWYQCKYCPSNFNTNKKLAIHINSHDEFDSNDYSCKDCGNVYSGRKSLWVHRYKKHPQVPDPAECTLCRKMFFDRQMLENHTPTCNRKPITATGAHQQQEQGQQLLSASQQQQRAVFKHKTGDDDDDEEDDDQLLMLDGAGSDSNGGANTNTHTTTTTTSNTISTNKIKIRMPEVACTICGARFTDQEMFEKHIEKHEQELYVDNPLAAMFDDGPADAGQFQVERQNENGEYACDLCAKTFPQVIALKVHRKWHFRGDSKQNLTNDSEATQLNSLSNNNNNNNNNSLSNSSMLQLRELHAVGLMPNQQQQQKQQQQQLQQNSNNNSSSSSSAANKSLKRKRELKCEYCASTFISNNNLRRHMYELHKHEVSNLPEPPVIEVDEALCCRRCGDLRFESKELWIEHKLADAKVVRPFCPFQWGCDLCGEYLSRKEKLINHINNHLKEDVIVPVATKPMATAKSASTAKATPPATAIQAEAAATTIAAVATKTATTTTATPTVITKAIKQEEQTDEDEQAAAVTATATATSTAAAGSKEKLEKQAAALKLGESDLDEEDSDLDSELDAEDSDLDEDDSELDEEIEDNSDDDEDSSDLDDLIEEVEVEEVDDDGIVDDDDNFEYNAKQLNGNDNKQQQQQQQAKQKQHQQQQQQAKQNELLVLHSSEEDVDDVDDDEAEAIESDSDDDLEFVDDAEGDAEDDGVGESMTIDDIIEEDEEMPSSTSAAGSGGGGRLASARGGRARVRMSASSNGDADGDGDGDDDDDSSSSESESTTTTHSTGASADSH
ncbi:zinc finger protein hangover [Drosophila busckii]|uniref:zinc finger protein hangover n=1 Tax=Drosophila busckii TaxID=30019 RepID=UPI00083EF513|nr:zinc finger protein hangover [Drosophila busckii]